MDIIEILEIPRRLVVILTPTTTIPTILNEYMNREGLNLSQFAKQTGVNVGSLSYILNGNRTLSIEQLDLITEAMGLAKGYFYDQYFKEVLVESVPNWRKIKPFLYGCARIGNLDSIEKTVQLLLDNLMYSPLLFETAEDFYKAGKKEAAIILYDNVALSEKSQHSERLALCQYRLFMCKLEQDQERNYRAAIQFELFVDKLDEYDQLDALKDLANTYRSLRRWDKVEEMAERLKDKAGFQYQKGFKFSSDHQPVRPLFTYLAYSYLLLGSVWEVRENYEIALQYVDLYAKLDWVKEDDPETQQWKDKFKKWAEMNRVVTKLSSGDFSVLPAYISSIELNGDEAFLSLLNIIEAANRYNFNVDDVFHSIDIPSITEKDYNTNEAYTSQFIIERLARFFYELACYYLKKGESNYGFSFLIKSLQKSTLINEKTCIIKCVGLFESFREYCDHETILAYQKLIAEVYKNEKKVVSTPVK